MGSFVKCNSSHAKLMKRAHGVLSPTGEVRAHVDCGAPRRSQDRTARLWDERGKGATTVFAVRQPAHCAALAESLGAVLVGDECGDITVFDRRLPSSPLYALKTHKDVARRLAISKARSTDLPLDS